MMLLLVLLLASEPSIEIALGERMSYGNFPGELQAKLEQTRRVVFHITTPADRAQLAEWAAQTNFTFVEGPSAPQANDLALHVQDGVFVLDTTQVAADLKPVRVGVALRKFTLVATTHDSQLSEWLTQGVQAAQVSKWDDARIFWSRVLEQEPRSAAAMVNLAAHAAATRDNQQALALLEKAAATDVRWIADFSDLAAALRGVLTRKDPDAQRASVKQKLDPAATEGSPLQSLTSLPVFVSQPVGPPATVLGVGKSNPTLLGLSERAFDLANLRLVAHKYPLDFVASTRWSFVTNPDGTISICTLQTKTPLATLLVYQDGEWALFTPQGYFAASARGAQRAGWMVEDNATKKPRKYSFAQFDARMNRPDIVLYKLGLMASPLATLTLRGLHEKRIARRGLSEKGLGTLINTPDVVLSAVPAQVNGRFVAVEIMATAPAQLERLVVWINGAPIYGSGGLSLREERTRTLHRTLTLDLTQGRNEITISVIDAQGMASEVEPIVVNATFKGQAKRRIVVTIGAQSMPVLKPTKALTMKTMSTEARKLLQTTSPTDEVIVFSTSYDEALGELLDGVAARKKLLLIGRVDNTQAMGSVLSDLSQATGTLVIAPTAVAVTTAAVSQALQGKAADNNKDRRVSAVELRDFLLHGDNVWPSTSELDFFLD